MKIIKPYFKGLKTTLSSTKMTFVIYFFTLFLALLVALPFKSMLSDAVGKSMSTYTLLSDFDYTAYKDFLLQHEDVIKYFQKQFIWFGLFYLISSIFISGGILSVIHNKKNKSTLKTFFVGCGEYFSRFLRLAVILIPLHLLIAALVFGAARFIIKSQIESFKSEVDIVIIASIGILIYLFLAVLIFIVSDYSKIVLVQNDSTKVLNSLGKGVKFTFQHLISTYSLYLLLLALPFLLIISYFVLETKIGMVSSSTIIGMFVVQQIFVGLRIFVKVWFLASQYSYHSEFFVPDIKEPEQVLIAESEEWNFDDLKEPDIVKE